MYVKDLIKFYNVKPNGILHVGAHLAEESEEYRDNNWDNGKGVIGVEAQLDCGEFMKSHLDSANNKIYHAVIWNQNNIEMELNKTSKTASTSLLKFGSHSTIYPEINITDKIKVKTIRLDTLLVHSDEFELVVLDIQGAEARAIESLGNRIHKTKWIFMEVSKKPLYVGTMLVDELDEYLGAMGFKRVFTAWDRRAGWGDALYARKLYLDQTFSQNIFSKLLMTKIWLRQWIPLPLFPILVEIKKSFRFLFMKK